MKRYADHFLIACFLTFLVLAMAVTLLRPKDVISYYENRTLAQMPNWTAESAGSGTYAGAWERYLADHAAGRNTLLKLKTRLDLLLGRPMVNDVVLADSGSLLPYLKLDSSDKDSVRRQAEDFADRQAEIRDTVQAVGGHFCYVAVPCQYASRQSEYPWYMENRARLTQLATQSLADAMAEREVDYLDLGPSLDPSRVDNHYGILGAYQVYRAVMDWANSVLQEPAPVLTEEDLTLTALPNPYMGSRTRKLMGLVWPEESLCLLEPKEPVAFTRWNNGQEVDAAVYALPSGPEETLTYGLYMGGDIAQTRIDTGREELPTVLIYGDSFTNALECVLYLSFDEMHSLDLRHWKDGTLEDYIAQVRPDIVICVRDYEALLALSNNGGGE